MLTRCRYRPALWWTAGGLCFVCGLFGRHHLHNHHHSLDTVDIIDTAPFNCTQLMYAINNDSVGIRTAARQWTYTSQFDNHYWTALADADCGTVDDVLRL